MDLNTLINTNINPATVEEVTKNDNYSEFQVPNSSHSFDINNFNEIVNIENNNLQTMETKIDTNQNKDNFDINNLTSEINKNVDIMNNNFDLNNIMVKTEKTQNFETSQNFMNSRIKPWLVIWESRTAVSALCPVKRTRMRVKWLRLKPGRRGCEK